MRGDELSIDCNDEGAVFLEARIGLKLSESLNNPREEILQLLFPDGLHYKDANLSTPLVVQITFFECGGMAIAVCVSHKLMDMASMCSFINNWAATTRNPCEEISIEFNIGNQYPPLDMPPFQLDITGETNFCLKTTRLVFCNSKTAKLKALVAQEAESPTRVELVTAIICKVAKSVATKISGNSKQISFWQTVNLRERTSPPLTENHFGNFIGGYFVASAEQDNINNNKDNFKWLVREIRRGKTEYLAHCGRESAAEEVCLRYWETLKKISELCYTMKYDNYECTSWCRFPHYEADFGWGKPAWVTTTCYITKSAILLMDTRDGDGIEAVITLEEPEIALFERDGELAFASVYPSRLDAKI